MKLSVLMLALFMGASLPVSASEARFYIGTFTNHSGSKGIYRASLDTDSGKLAPPALAGEAPNPGFVALSANGKYLYAACEQHEGSVVAFRVEAGGGLGRLNQQSSGGSGNCHVWVDAAGANVLASNYGGGSAACIRTQPDGSLGERTALVAFTGSGPNRDRQRNSCAHSILTDPANRFAYCCDLGSDSVWILKLDAFKGTLTPANPPAGKVPPGSGPRHLSMSADGQFVYVCNELGHSVTVFARDADTGALDPLQTVPATLPEGADRAAFTTAEISLHPTGKWLYISNRDLSKAGHDSFSVFSLARDGRLSEIQAAPSPVKIPRGFAIDPTGKWLVAAGQADSLIAVMKIDQGSGKLSATDQAAKVPEPVCVLFAPPTK